MLIRQKIAACILAAGALLLSGCETIEELMPKEEWIPSMNAALSVEEDGSLTEILKDTLDQSYYSSSDLQSMINSEISQYNKTNGEGKVALEVFETDGKTVKVQLKYASAEDYALFNNTEVFNGSMISAQLDGYLFDTEFDKVRNGSVVKDNISEKELYKEIDENVLIIRGPVEVHVPGRILAISDNTEVITADSAYATGVSSVKQEEDLILPSNDVFKRSEKIAFKTQQIQKRSYIVYSSTE